MRGRPASRPAARQCRQVAVPPALGGPLAATARCVPAPTASSANMDAAQFQNLKGCWNAELLVATASPVSNNASSPCLHTWRALVRANPRQRYVRWRHTIQAHIHKSRRAPESAFEENKERPCLTCVRMTYACPASSRASSRSAVSCTVASAPAEGFAPAGSDTRVSALLGFCCAQHHASCMHVLQ